MTFGPDKDRTSRRQALMTIRAMKDFTDSSSRLLPTKRQLALTLREDVRADQRVDSQRRSSSRRVRLRATHVRESIDSRTTLEVRTRFRTTAGICRSDWSVCFT